jgi:hypothetical protein
MPIFRFFWKNGNVDDRWGYTQEDAYQNLGDHYGSWSSDPTHQFRPPITDLVRCTLIREDV